MALPLIAATSVALRVNYPANATLNYDVQVTSQVVVSGASTENFILTNHSVVVFRTGATSASGYNVDLSFARFETQVIGNGPTASEIRQTSAANDARAVKDARLLVHVKPTGEVEVLSRPAAGTLDQEVSMLEQFARADVFPGQSVSVGAKWVRNRSEDVPNLHVNVPLVMNCFLTSLQDQKGGQVATIDIGTHGKVEFAGATPGSFELTGKTENQYLTASGLLTHSTGQTENVVRLGQPPTTTRLDSRGTVQLLSGS
jgi:hypothetical protein